jgi:hypothetical protein
MNLEQLRRQAKLMQQARRCLATSKRSGLTCRAPAVPGWRVCRCHGARGGAPEGKANGRYQHGNRTKTAIAFRREVGSLLRKVRGTLSEEHRE